MKLLSTLVQPHFLSLQPYSSARDEYTGTEGIFLDANENPFSSVLGMPFNRYPDPHQKELKEKLSELKGVKPSRIFLGNGSDEPIDLLIKLTCHPKHNNIVILPPTYGMYEVCAAIQQVEVRKAPLTPDFQIDVEAVAAAVTLRTKIIWICSPNNPSGNLLKASSIKAILKNHPQCIVVVDEAYIDFTDEPSFIYQIDKYENLAVLQTFSKAWGMAGLRIGACYAREELIHCLDKIKYPYNINVLTQVMATKALKKSEKKDEYVAKIVSNRNWLEKKLSKQSWVKKVYPSDSNQLLVKFKNAPALFAYLIGNKVIVRDRTKVLHGTDCLRISIGKKSELEQLFSLMKKFYEK